MSVVEAHNKDSWNSFVLSQSPTPFTQSWEWGEFQKVLGRNVWRLESVSDNGELCGAALVVEYPLPFAKRFLYIPRGPIVKKDSSRAVNELIQSVKTLAEEQGAIFVRIDSLTDKQTGLRPAPEYAYRSAITQPKTEWMVDVSQSEEDLLKNMHEKTRYNIRLAQKKGVHAMAHKGKDAEHQFNSFLSLLGETAVRDQFHLHPTRHYEALIEAFHEHAEIVTARFEGKLLAAGLILFFGDTATYLYGGSSSENRNLMAPYAMHWEAIKRAKEKGCRCYSFGGVNDTDLAGVTRFKQGFGGASIDFPGSFDMIVNPFWYWLYNFARRVKK